MIGYLVKREGVVNWEGEGGDEWMGEGGRGGGGVGWGGDLT